jgi:hypothetical protein
LAADAALSALVLRLLPAWDDCDDGPRRRGTTARGLGNTAPSPAAAPVVAVVVVEMATEARPRVVVVVVVRTLSDVLRPLTPRPPPPPLPPLSAARRRRNAAPSPASLVLALVPSSADAADDSCDGRWLGRSWDGGSLLASPNRAAPPAR